MKAQLIGANGEINDVAPANGKNFSLKELQTFVGGYIERVQLPDGREMYCDEEGKLKKKSPNVYATMLAELLPHDIIVGDVIVGDYKLFRDPEELQEDGNEI